MLIRVLDDGVLGESNTVAIHLGSRLARTKFDICTMAPIERSIF